MPHAILDVAIERFAEDVFWHVTPLGKTALIVEDGELASRIVRPHLSVSTAHAFDCCPARMCASKGLPRKYDLFGAAELGNAAHSVLERLMQLPQGERTPENASGILTELAVEEPCSSRDIDYARLIDGDPATYARWITSVINSYSGLWKIEDPNTIDVYATEFDLSSWTLEGVPLVGYVDRIDRLPNGTLAIRDYKTGILRKPYPGSRDEYGQQIQIYAKAVAELTGEKVTKGSLYYVRETEGKVRQISVREIALADAAAQLMTSWQEIKSAEQELAYPATPSALCSWCPIVNVCPVARLSAKPNAIAARQLAADEWVLPIQTRISRNARTFAPRYMGRHEVTKGTKVMPRTLPKQNPKPWAEGAPHLKGEWIDGHPNLQGWSATAAFSLQHMATEELRKTDFDMTGTASSDLIFALAQTYGAIIETALLRVVGHAEIASFAHSRARGLLYDILADWHFPLFASEREITQWMTKVTRLLQERLAMGIALCGDENEPTQFKAIKPWGLLASSIGASNE